MCPTDQIAADICESGAYFLSGRSSCSSNLGWLLAKMEFVNPEGLRLDGRRPMEMRQLRAQIGAVAKADGSAVFEMGNTKVIAAVYGPREVQNRSQQINDQALVRCEYSMANFSTGDRRRKPKGDRRSTEISLVIRQTMEECILTNLMPRSQIDIYVQVLQADGGTRSACINAATLALADAGIPMRDLVTSCSAGFLNSTPLLDLNYVEDSAGGPDVTVGILPKLDKVTLLQMDAKLPIDTFENVMQLAVEGCKAIANYIREVLLENTKQLEYRRGLYQGSYPSPNPCLVIVGLSVVKSSLETCCIYRSCHLLSEFNSVNLLKS
uniref:Exosome complex component RRP41 isoform X1 n=2 Tax=Populus TaxID=3689 RepID=A0A4U5QZD2_POPAL|nr:exosome complex component RRP41 isoform X1 [Populus alba]